MFVFTLGEVITVLGSNPYASRRIPASHRGRVGGISSVVHSVFSSVTQYLISFMLIITASNYRLIWTIFMICGLAAVAYNLFVSYAQGGNAYEMLVSGNMKRVSAEQYGEGFKISTHKEAKEYRVWKGFAIGGFCALFTLLAGVFMGANQARVNSVFQKGNSWGVGFGLGVIACFLLSGWSVLPFFYLNASGVAISYFVSCAFAIIPVAATGGMYIAGAYGRRNKNVRQQELADRAARAEANKPKKINYGGLPGTKPKKRK
jgi:hypothetical protein